MMKNIALVFLALLLTYASPCVAQVTSVSNSDGTLTISPATGAVVASLAAAPTVSTSMTAPFFNATTTGTGYELGGIQVLFFPASDTTSIALGQSALASQSLTSQDNVGIGYEAGEYVESTQNVAIGNYALLGYPSLTGSYNIAIGGLALVNAQGVANGNTAIGYVAGEYITTSSNNTAIGYDAMHGTSASPLTSTQSHDNTAIGVSALFSLQGTGNQDTAIGAYAGGDISTGSDDVAIGFLTLAGSGSLLTGNNNVAVGDLALYDLQGGASDNAAIGFDAGEYVTTGSSNTAIGYAAMQGTSATPLTGSYNTGVGNSALLKAQGAAKDNTTLGYGAGQAITNGTDNTLVGYEAGYGVTGNSNIIIGEDPSSAITTGGSNILIGNNLTKVTNSSSNQIDIGDVITVTGTGTPSTSNTTIQGNLTVNGSIGGANAAIFSSGQLLCGGSNCNNSTGSTTLSYCPYKGNLKTTAEYGNYTIPSGTASSGCLTATLTSMYVGGTAAQSAAANTLYYVYLINVSGTTYLDLETTGHATDSTTGIEVESGNSANTLVGMIETNGSKKVFTGGQTNTVGDTNTVATWDNRRPTTTTCKFTANRTVSGAAVEINSENRCLFMSWADAAMFASTQNGYNSANGGDNETLIVLDGTGGTVSALPVQSTANYNNLLVAPNSYSPTEGYHYTTLLGETTVGSTGTWVGLQPTTVFTIQ